MKIIGIIQARMSSTRLPGKVILKAVGKPLIVHMLERVGRCRRLDEVWLATSDESTDDVLVQIVTDYGFPVFRGELDNVLSRFWNIGKNENADVIVRLTGDCPLHDHGVIDSVIELFIENRKNVDYVSNVLPSTFPDGLDTEVFSFRALDEAYKNATSPADLEHVVPYIRRKTVELNREMNFFGPADFSHLRWTLDEAEDYTLIRSAFEDIYPHKGDFNFLDTIAWQTEDPKRLEVNKMHTQSKNRDEKIWQTG